MAERTHFYHTFGAMPADGALEPLVRGYDQDTPRAPCALYGVHEICILLERVSEPRIVEVPQRLMQLLSGALVDRV